MAAMIKLFGEKELQKKLESFAPKLQKKMLRSAMTKAARIVAASAKALVPVVSGDLKKSIKVVGLAKQGTVKTAGGWKSAGRAGIGKRVVARMPYAHIIEKGRKNSKAQPFLNPALMNNAERVLQMIRDDVKEQMREMSAKSLGK
jgi:HK97 gp10 family phage protein